MALVVGMPTAQGRRVPDTINGYIQLEPGTEWIGSLGSHTVTEHDDGTWTVDPSILIRSGPGMTDEWHGWLRAGIWEW